MKILMLHDIQTLVLRFWQALHAMFVLTPRGRGRPFDMFLVLEA